MREPRRGQFDRDFVEGQFIIEGEGGASVEVLHWHTGESVGVRISYDKRASSYFVTDREDVEQHWIPALDTDWVARIYREPDLPEGLEKTGKGGIRVHKNGDNLEIEPFFNSITYGNKVVLGKEQAKMLKAALEWKRN